VLDVKDFAVRFTDRDVEEEAVHGISFTMASGEILGLVGESGSGKTVTALSLMGLLRGRQAVTTGQMLFNGQDLLSLSFEQMRSIQGKQIAMIFQEPKTSLNPLMKVGRQVEEALRVHTSMSAAERRKRALEAMESVELPDPERVYRQYPHELSGGMRQRAMIAAAILLEPNLLLCDEPTTALDAHTQEQILALLTRINRERGVGILFISHDLQVVRKLCRRAIVMQDGYIVEQGDVETLFTNPQNAYTKQLLDSIPGRGRRRE